MNLAPTSLLENVSRPLLELTPIGCALIDQDGHIISVTRSFAEAVSSPVKQLFGQNIFDILACANGTAERNLLAEGRMMRVVTLQDGRLLNWTVHRTARGAALSGYYVGLLYHATEHNSEIHTADQCGRLSSRGILTAELAHEIAGPLNVITNNAELLLDGETDPESRQFLEAMRDEAQRLGNLLSEFLMLARNAQLKTVAHDVTKILEQPIRWIHHQQGTKKITLTVEAEPNLPQVAGEGTRLQQLFFNLLKNAFDASSDGGTIRILVRRGQLRSETAIEVVVIDHGSGISTANLERVFEPFYSTKPAGSGTGLGLPIARRIVSDHDGELSLTSVAGKGTTATVLLPIIWQEAISSGKDRSC